MLSCIINAFMSWSRCYCSRCINGSCLSSGSSNNLCGLSLSSSQDLVTLSCATLSTANLNDFFLLSNCSLRLIIIKNRTVSQTSPFNDLRYSLFPFNSHDMGTCYTFYFTYLIDNINADINTLIFLVFGSLKTPDHIISYIHAWYKFLHVACHTQRLGWGYTSKDLHFFMETKLTNHLHKFSKAVNIINDLGLNKISTIGNLLTKTFGTKLMGEGKWIGSTT